MSEAEDKQREFAERFRQMVNVTKQDDKDNEQKKLAHQFYRMMEVTKKNDTDERQKEWSRQFAEMMQATQSFDSERERLEKAGETAISDAFRRMIDLTHQLEKEGDAQLEQEEQKIKSEFKFPPNVNIEQFPGYGDKFFHTLVNKLPPKIRRFPRAFRKNPIMITKYFLAMIAGRILAITLYVVAAFIPALPLPDSLAGSAGKIPSAVGSALGSMRGFVTELSFQSVSATVTNIPTDINKLLQKIGEFFQYYGKRAGRFIVKIFRHPKAAFNDTRSFVKGRSTFFLRLGKGAIGVAFSFLAIKLAMVFLIPIFGGIAITVLGFKISIIIIVAVRMLISTLSEFIGKLIGGKLLRLCKAIYRNPAFFINKTIFYLTDMMNETEKITGDEKLTSTNKFTKQK